MNANALLEELQRRGVVLQVVGDKIRFPRDSVPPALLEEMRRHKPELLRLLSQPAATCVRCGRSLPPRWDLCEACRRANEACIDCGQPSGRGYVRCSPCVQAGAPSRQQATWPLGCALHKLTEAQVERWWNLAQERDADVSVCACCGGPAPSGVLACRRCE